MQLLYVWEEDGSIRPAKDAIDFGLNFDGDRHVQHDDIEGHNISTVFLATDHGFSMSPDSEPVLFETMIFGPLIDGEYQERYTSVVDAVEGHKRAIAWLKEKLG